MKFSRDNYLYYARTLQKYLNDQHTVNEYFKEEWPIVRCCQKGATALLFESISEE